MIIGIDIDDTLVSTTESFEQIIKKYNVNFNKTWKDDWTLEEKNFIFDKYLDEILLNAKLKDNTKEVLEYLNNKGHKLVIITARNNKYCKSIEEKTVSFIEKENLPILKIYFDQIKKSDLARKLKLDLMIDDSLYVYNNMKKEGIDTILFGDEIKTWDEVLEYIKKMEV